MAVLTVRNIDEELKRRLRIAAAERGLSMEEHARQILRASIGPIESNLHWVDRFRAAIAGMGDIELELPGRGGTPRDIEFPE